MIIKISQVLQNIDLIEQETGIYVDKLNISIEDYANKINEIYEYNCSPLATHSFISQYFVSNFCKENNIKVLLTGDGGDELLEVMSYTRIMNI